MTQGLIKIDQWGKIAKVSKDGNLPLPFVQEIFLFECEIAGTGFVKDIAAKAEALADGETVSLVREPDNKYDKMAIRIDNAAGEKLGYIPRQQNEIPARLLDGGKMLFAKVAGKEISEFSSWVNIFIRIYMKDL